MKPTAADIYSLAPDGTKTDAWIFDEILGHDTPPPNDPYTHVIDNGNIDDGSISLLRDEDAEFLLGGEGSGNFGHEGRPGEVGGSGPARFVETKRGGVVEMRPATKDDAAHLKSLKVPPAWTDVHVSTDRETDLQAIGVDAKGRTGYRYNAAHTEESAAEKFDRLREFHKAVPGLRDQIRADLHDASLSPQERESAWILYLIDKTAFRPGSDRDTRAAKQAYGATTLQARHVAIDGDKIRFRFTGKSGVSIDKTITDGTLAKELARRTAGAARTDPLFPTASDGHVRIYLHARDGDFKPKDFRTWHGTHEALRVMEKMPVPKSEAAFKKAQRVVATRVSRHLGNTPAVALKSYIDPAVWSAWKARKLKKAA